MVDSANHLSNRAYSKRREVSEKTVRKWLDQGKIERDAKTGKIDPDKADDMLEKNLGRLPKHGHDAERINGYSQKKLDGKRVSLTEVQTKKVNAEAQLAERKVAEQQGLLVHRAAAEEFAFKLAREERDALVAWPGRIGNEFTLDLEQKGLNARNVISLLEKYVKRHLAERSQSHREHI